MLISTLVNSSYLSEEAGWPLGAEELDYLLVTVYGLGKGELSVAISALLFVDITVGNCTLLPFWLREKDFHHENITNICIDI